MRSLTLKRQNVKKGERSDVRLLKPELLPRDLTKESHSPAVTDCNVPSYFQRCKCPGDEKLDKFNLEISCSSLAATVTAHCDKSQGERCARQGSQPLKQN